MLLSMLWVSYNEQHTTQPWSICYVTVTVEGDRLLNILSWNWSVESISHLVPTQHPTELITSSGCSFVTFQKYTSKFSSLFCSCFAHVLLMLCSCYLHLFYSLCSCYLLPLYSSYSCCTCITHFTHVIHFTHTLLILLIWLMLCVCNSFGLRNDIGTLSIMSIKLKVSFENCSEVLSLNYVILGMH